MTMLPYISVVIPTYNGAALLEKCLATLQSQSFRNMEIIVVDNASCDSSVETVLAAGSGVRVLRQDRNLGFAGAVNEGIQKARGNWIAVLNNDTELPQDWLAECAGAIQRHPEAAFFACRIVDFHNRGVIYSAGDCFLRAGIGYRRGQEMRDGPEFREEIPIFSACGCAALYRRDVLLEMGAFDSRLFAYFEDVDLGLRLQLAGYRGYYLPRAEVFHHGSATSGGEFSPLSVRLRTRNSLLLLFKSVPGLILLRCLPMITMAQLAWMARAVRHGRARPYLRGLANAIMLAPAMARDRAVMRRVWNGSGNRLWQSILESEALARRAARESDSLFLRWYFRFFCR